MTFKVAFIATSALSLSLVAGCSSSTSDGGLDPGTQQQVEERNTNPDGVAYPAKGIGVASRDGTKKGSVIQNFKFLGYPTAGATLNGKGSLTTVALADFYDPDAKKFKLIHLVVSAVWCAPCNAETDAIVAAYPGLAEQGVVVVQGLSDGPDQSKGATKLDLDAWIDDHKSNFTQFLDPSVQKLGVFFKAAAVPWNAYVDPRSMEILYSNVGGVDVKKTAQTYLDWVKANPATKFE